MHIYSKTRFSGTKLILSEKMRKKLAFGKNYKMLGFRFAWYIYNMYNIQYV